MREIKFRGKRIDNGEWVYGFAYEHEPPLQCFSPTEEKSKWYIAKTAFADWNMPRQVEFVEVDPNTVSQYTGLKDKNGKEIYEGDILRTTVGDGFVYYDDRICGYGVKYNKVDCNLFLDFFMKKVPLLIIGNIHDSPELLKEE